MQAGNLKKCLKFNTIQFSSCFNCHPYLPVPVETRLGVYITSSCIFEIRVMYRPTSLNYFCRNNLKKFTAQRIKIQEVAIVNVTEQPETARHSSRSTTNFQTLQLEISTSAQNTTVNARRLHMQTTVSSKM